MRVYVHLLLWFGNILKQTYLHPHHVSRRAQKKSIIITTIPLVHNFNSNMSSNAFGKFKKFRQGFRSLTSEHWFSEPAQCKCSLGLNNTKRKIYMILRLCLALVLSPSISYLCRIWSEKVEKKNEIKRNLPRSLIWFRFFFFFSGTQARCRTTIFVFIEQKFYVFVHT